jgi:uncharacterized protein YeaO (DUF488 family)
MTEQSRIRLKRVYEPPARDDGVRILVDRLWPRGLRKDDVHFDQWRKDLAPTTPLRQALLRWTQMGHDAGSQRVGAGNAFGRAIRGSVPAS